jgi:broad specificity phosphatase PhoE
MTDSGMIDIAQRAVRLVKTILPNERISIISSPEGRPLFTAKVILSLLRAEGFQLTRRDIIENVKLGEMDNFFWSHYSAVVFGGKVEFAGKSFMVKKADTNPHDLSFREYYHTDAWSKVSSEVRAKLPKSYVSHLDQVESFQSVSTRLIGVLSRIGNRAPTNTPERFILSTHDALAGFPAEVFSGGKIKGLALGESLDMEFVGNQLFVTRVGELTEGRSTVDLFEAYKEYFKKK